MWVELKISIVSLYELSGVVFIDSVENQLSFTSAVVILSNWVVSFSTSRKGEIDSSVASNIVANEETLVVTARAIFPQDNGKLFLSLSQ